MTRQTNETGQFMIKNLTMSLKTTLFCARAEHSVAEEAIIERPGWQDVECGRTFRFSIQML